jgi:PLD-like domain
MAPVTVKAYAGRGSALLAFDVDPSLQPELAGFAVQCKPPGGKRYWLTNRLNFKDQVVADTTPDERRQIQTATNKAPFQKFHWAHFPEDVVPGEYEYRVTAMRFKPGSADEVEPGPSKTMPVTLVDELHDRFKLGFTRGYVSSQAYAERFDNSPLTPKPQTLDYDTAPFEERYAWLGFGARKLVFEFLEEAIGDPSVRLDVFAYDLDEPDFIRGLIKLGSRLRLYLDNSDDHARPTDSEVLARQAIEHAHGQVRVGCFQRYAHDKVMILKRHGKAQKVLSGSANFQVRGLYVQSNNVFVFDDPDTAALYEKAFQASWNHPDEFADQKIASGWFERSGPGLPNFAVSFSPHKDGETALARVSEAIRKAQSSVLFAVMEIGRSTGSVVRELERLPERPEIYGFGTTQKLDGRLKTATPSDPNPRFMPWSYLKSKVPSPFRAEWSGGSGQVIHHKFVVVDFNGDNPSAFAGSSNLAKLGEEQNGDNLVQFTDPAVVTAFAVEAIQLVDHYRFRAVQSHASSSNPLRLKRRGEDWSSAYFKPGSPKLRERELFIS